MRTNPYEPPNAASHTRQPTRATRWMLVVGVGALVLAAFLVITTIVMVNAAYNAISHATDSAQAPELVSDMSAAMFPSAVALPLTVVGIVIIVVGFLRREPVPPA